MTILLTGASGFIAKHVAVKLLNAGYPVRGTVRRLDRGPEVIAAVRPHLTDATALDQRLSFAATDLENDAGWAEAMQGVTAVMHTASPFPLAQPKNEDELIRPAVEGTLRVLKAAQAAGVKRVILTSSVAAVSSSVLPANKSAYDETCWTDVTHPTASAYVKSKTLAERAAWEFVGKHPEMQLTTINPVLVLGPPLDDNYGSSVSVVERVLRAKDPMVPKIGFPVVDVRDVAEMHLRALTMPGTEGQRFIASDGFMWFFDIARTLKTAYPQRRIVTMKAPGFVVRILALFDGEIRAILPLLGQRGEVSNAKAREVLGMTFIPASDATLATADWLIRNAKV